MLRLRKDGQRSNVKSRHVNGINVVRNPEHHVSAGYPHAGRALQAETVKDVHEAVNVGPQLRPLEVDGLVPWLVRRGIGHEGVSTRTEGECRSLDKY